MKVKLSEIGLVLVAMAITLPVHADSIPEWANSFSANDQCYCAPSMETGLQSKIVPTPVGGQSIGQVCSRIGSGPELTLTDGRFSHPVYSDAQCGNGPFAADTSAGESSCQGRMDLEGLDCQGTGPDWNLAVAYAKPLQESVTTVATAEPEPTSEVTIVSTAPVSAEPLQEATTEPLEIAAAEPEPVPETSVESTPAKGELPLATIVDTRPVDTEPVQEALPARVVTEAPSEPEINFVTPTQEAAPAQKDVEVAAAAAEEAREFQRSDRNLEARELASELVDEKEAERKITMKAPVPGETRQEAADAVIADADQSTDNSAVTTALKLPIPEDTRRRNNNFIQVSPTGYDYGGYGVALGGKLAAGSLFSFVGRASVVEDYTEYMLGVGMGFSPAALRGGEIAVVVGVENGEFNLESTELAAIGGSTELAETGGVVEGSIGYDIGRRMRLQGGVNYSSFFEGDPTVFGQFLLHMTRDLDIASRVEGGDNDNVSVGIRFNY